MKTSVVMSGSVTLQTNEQRSALNGSRQPAIKRMQCRGFGLEQEQLVEQCLVGNQEAWAELVGSYRGLIYSIAARFGAKHQDAADIFQAVCIEVFNSLPQLRNVRSLKSWLITVSLRQAYRWKRRLPNDVELDAMDLDAAAEIATAPEVFSQFQQEDVVRKAIAQLKPRNAELVRLLFFEQPPLPYTEIAKRLGLATGSIGFIRARCLTKLRKALIEVGFYVP
ncbi:MAG TPA: sigma-70 family RNA polymerase sigma factor [Candidatus Angelobacter sp.]|jgi:RNA polymerase sigma factor (sigma-70 family)|nr:sigma-70 family RNA polymerase sigma factor [Candidatus Angelobacter sp.]